MTWSQDPVLEIKITKKDLVLILLLPAGTKCALTSSVCSPQSLLVWTIENDVALLSHSMCLCLLATLTLFLTGAHYNVLSEIPRPSVHFSTLGFTLMTVFKLHLNCIHFTLLIMISSVSF